MLRNIAWRVTLALAVLVSLSAPLAFAQEAEPADMTLAEVLAMNLEARGGDAVSEMNSLRYTGKMSMGGMELPFTMEWKRPEKVRIEFVVQGTAGIQAFDGETAWAHMPFMGQANPEKLPEDQAKALAEMADSAEGPLVNWEEKGHTVEYLGTEEVDGTMAHKLKVVLKSGDERTIYLDTDYGLEFKTLGKTTIQGQEIEGETEIGDYKEVGDLVIAHSMESKQNGAPGGQVLTIEKVEVNVDIPDDRFAMPAPAETDEADETDNG